MPLDERKSKIRGAIIVWLNGMYSETLSDPSNPDYDPDYIGPIAVEEIVEQLAAIWSDELQGSWGQSVVRPVHPVTEES